MNILIVGNGFDLSHYLPTKYDHFMVAMAAIESWDESKGDMGFDDLFRELYEKEDYFFGYTKAIYQTEDIKISVDEIEKLQKQLKENVWYQYFSEHVKEIKTWIDFENKIELALKASFFFFDEVKRIEKTQNAILDHISFWGEPLFNQVYLKREYCNILRILNLFNSGYYQENKDRFGNTIYLENYDEKYGDLMFFINKDYIFQGNGYRRIKLDKFVNDLNLYLNKFVSIFNFYLEKVVSSLLNEIMIKYFETCLYVRKIYSFNYTTSFFHLYHENIMIDFLHGKLGLLGKNIVLGVSDLDRQYLHEYSFYGFTKYHQKLMKDTDYLFLNEFKSKVKSFQNDLIRFEKIYGHNSEDVYQKELRRKFALDLNFYIWGHSLDVSDQEYIIDLFSLNDDIDRNVKVTVFYFDNNAKFSLLANLLHILGKEKVEHWMKQGWLKFEPNPDIAQLNEIQPVELPKHES